MDKTMEDSGVVPETVMDSMTRTLANVEQLKTNLPEFLSFSGPEALSEMPPLQRAQSLHLLAKATSTLFALRLRCSGIHPDEHPIKTELERLSLYEDKLQRFINLSKAPLRPSTRLNHQAAARFIEHALPDLTPDQKQSMRDISREEGTNMMHLKRNDQKKRKYQSSERSSVQTAAKEFLEKAAQELLGDNKDGFKGPLRAEAVEVVDLTMED